MRGEARVITDLDGWRHGLRLLLLVAGLSMATAARAADPMPYSLTLAPTGNADIDQAITDASQLATLREESPVGPFALIARAESDAGRFDSVLRSFGYYDAAIQIRIAGLDTRDPALLPLLEGLSAAPPVVVAVQIEPGPLYTLGVVRLDGPVPENVRVAFALKPGEPARAAPVLEAGAAVLRALRDDGYALASVPPPDAMVDHNTRTMDVIYLSDPGPKVALGPVSITGLERLREDYVLRRLNLHPGEPYSPSRLEAARKDLLAGGVLAWARLTPATTPDAAGQLPLALDVAERPPRVLRFAGAYSTDEGGSVSTSWTHRNVFGRAEQLTVKGEIGHLLESAPEDLSYLANVSLRIPDLWLRNLDLRLDVGGVKESLDAYDREAITAGATLERRFAAGLTGGAGLAFQRSRIVQDGTAQHYQLLSLPLTLAYDTTDDPLDPRRGLRLGSQITPTQVLEGDGSGFVVGRVAGSAYFDLTSGLTRSLLASLRGADSDGADGERGRSILAGRFALGTIVGAGPEAVPPDWRFYAGGGGSVRGYPFQSIGPKTVSGAPAGGDGLLEAGLEWRQRIGENWGAVAFSDAGAVSADGIPGTGAMAIGVGLGVRYYTPIGPVRVDVATPLNHRDGDSPVQLYIGIGQAF